MRILRHRLTENLPNVNNSRQLSQDSNPGHLASESIPLTTTLFRLVVKKYRKPLQVRKLGGLGARDHMRRLDFKQIKSGIL